MRKLGFNRVVVAGVLSPFAAVLFYGITYSLLTAQSHNLERDWGFRLLAATAAMTVPSVLTFVLAAKESRRKTLSMSAKAGVGIAILTMGFIAKPVSDGILRSRQERNMALQGVAAPLFETRDITGRVQRLSDQRGKVVLINLWATWCGPCRIEMPKLDALYRERKDEGLVVFGLSAEDIDTQRKFLSKVSVSYPLLTVTEGVPAFYRDIARYPALFLVDRDGRLQPLPEPGGSFTKIEGAVDRLLDNPAKNVARERR
jgi:peroxiredoxin